VRGTPFDQSYGGFWIDLSRLQVRKGVHVKSKLKALLFVLSLLSSVLICGRAFAVSVDRIVIVPRQPDRYVRNVSAALNTKTGQTLVVWETHPGGPWPEYGQNHEVRGQLLGTDGKPIGSHFQMISSSLNPHNPGVIYNADINQFVLTYVKRKVGEYAEIYVTRLKSNGRRKGKQVLVSHPHNPAFEIFNFRPIILYDSENKAIIIFWERFVEGQADPADPKGIYGAILNSGLSFRQKPVLVQNTETGSGLTYGPLISDIQLHKPSGKLLIGQTMHAPVTFKSECLVAQVDRNLRSPATILNLDNDPEQSFCGTKLMQLPNGTMLSLFARDDGIKKRKIDSNGAPAGLSQKSFADPVRSVALGLSGLAFGSPSTPTEFALLGFSSSESEAAQFWLQRANANGTAAGPAIEIESGVDSVHGGIISSLPSTLQNGPLYAVLYIEGERDQPPHVNQGSGLVLLRVNTSP
jgi:hypothetical protein